MDESERQSEERVRLAQTERTSALEQVEALGNQMDRLRVNKQVAEAIDAKVSWIV